MPTYDYRCLECDHTFEVFQKITEDPLSNCPKCNGKVKRMIGPGAGPIFKGSGFYQTDYKNKPDNSKTASTTSKEKDSNTADKKNSGTSTKKNQD